MIGLSVESYDIEGVIVSEPVWDKGDKRFVVYILKPDNTFECAYPEGLKLAGFDPRFMEIMRGHS